jgi:phospholipase C
MSLRKLSVALILGTLPACAASAVAAGGSMPRYAHILVIIEENHTTDQIIGNAAAPALTRLSKTYGFASNFYAIRHPSEPNYVALVGGDTFGITDDDAFYCKAGTQKWGCEKSSSAGYADHTVDGENLTSQLEKAKLTWKGYFEDIPEPGSLTYRWPSPQQPVAGKPDSLYAVKHNGFMTFKNVQNAPDRTRRIVGFDVLEHDIAAGTLPNFAHMVPNQCNDMHGLHGHDVPADCTGKESAALIGRADRVAGELVDKIMHSAMWNGPENNAIVITFDENDDDRPSPHPNGCCGFSPGDASHPGGGWIPTIVITNHGPRGLNDPTPYNHYSLLRTIEDAFGLSGHLHHAGDDSKGVTTMMPLFAVTAGVRSKEGKP